MNLPFNKKRKKSKYLKMENGIIKESEKNNNINEIPSLDDSLNNSLNTDLVKPTNNNLKRGTDIDMDIDMDIDSGSNKDINEDVNRKKPKNNLLIIILKSIVILISLFLLALSIFLSPYLMNSTNKLLSVTNKTDELKTNEEVKQDVPNVIEEDKNDSSNINIEKNDYIKEDDKIENPSNTNNSSSTKFDGATAYDLVNIISKNNDEISKTINSLRKPLTLYYNGQSNRFVVYSNISNKETLLKTKYNNFIKYSKTFDEYNGQELFNAIDNRYITLFNMLSELNSKKEPMDMIETANKYIKTDNELLEEQTELLIKYLENNKIKFTKEDNKIKLITN